MHLITARLRAPGADDCRPPPAPLMRARELHDLVLALAAPADGIEHVYSEASPAGIDLCFFILQPTPDEAASAADRLCRRCIAATPRLAGWSLDGCGTGRVPHLPGVPGSVLPLQAADSRRGLSRN
ncbi:hypothetical protein [Streptosporangium sp. NPDC087985]|uniref:hypothetical protein n=1 Tax=Streptosporangium sp. NPDC087985 TaxID=3366196 RepID=UPI00380B0245